MILLIAFGIAIVFGAIVGAAIGYIIELLYKEISHG